ncbi:MAG: hypothetical protein GXP63_02765 [DPANN group archaeon]|nr:hypothetical protein [DPANN group archaeon]
MKEVDNQHTMRPLKALKRPKKEKQKKIARRLSNNIIATLALLLILISTSTNYYLITFSEPIKGTPTGLATGDVSLCVNHPPTGSENCSGTYLYTENISCFINATDPEGNPLAYYDNTTLFDVNRSGWVDINPTVGDLGNYSILFTVDDQTGCSNSGTDILANMLISDCIEPSWEQFKNSLSTNLSLFACWDNITDLRLGIPDRGLIRYDTTQSNVNTYDLDSHITIAHAFIYLNETRLPRLSKWATLTFYNLTMRQPKMFTSGKPCPANICDAPAYNGNVNSSGNVTVIVAHFTDYYVLDSAYIDLSDTTDTYTRYNVQNVTFYADYHYGNETDITDGSCVERLYGPHDIVIEKNMTYDPNASAFTYTTIIPRPGTYLWNVTCNRSDYYSISAIDNVTITNRRPVLIHTLPNETWPEDTVLTGRDLDNYFMDPDGDNLTYNSTLVANIGVQIDATTHVVTLTPEKDFNGNRNIIYSAVDPSGDSAPTNLIYLTVQAVDEPEPTQGAGGGAGGGSVPHSRCEEYWVCQDWTDCFPSGSKSRSCVDLTDCQTDVNKPPTQKNCTYIPTCYDHIKNGRETGVDCGGHCGPCPTCEDGIQNQEETGIDCGGPCPDICPSCTDGIQNQEETGIDCGGPCQACPTCEDGIQNQEETGIDCGGPCQACSERPFLEAPFGSSGPGMWAILALLLLPILLFIARKKLRQGYGWATYKVESYVHYLMTPKARKPEDIVESVFSKLETLHDHITAVTSHETIEQLVTEMREYVSLMLGIDYAFTPDELGKELENHRVPGALAQKIQRFFRLLETLRFSEEGLAQEHLERILGEAKQLVSTMAEQQGTLSSTITKGNANMLLGKVRRALRAGKIQQAAEAYKELLGVYHVLSERDKTGIYQQIKRIHGSIIKGVREAKEAGKE